MSVILVKQKIKAIYERRRSALYALAIHYAALAINYFRSVQPPKPGSKGKFWTNRTGQAAARMFTKAKRVNEWIGWMMGHGVQYGEYLELANDRRYAAINPIIKRYAGRFIRDAKKLFGDV